MTTASASQRVALSFEDGITRFIEVEEDQTIVDAAYKARINIPFDCRDGACGTCKAFCESGEYEEGEYIDEALTEEEADEGYVLCCQTYPLTEMLVNVPITSAAAKTGASTLIGTITELDQLSPSTIRFAVEIKDRESLSYLPGQYMNISPPNADFHRSYSFSSGPSDDIVTFLIKHTPGGRMTTYLTEQAAIGDELNLTGPMGSFFLREPRSPILLLAGGTGLAPILAILEHLAEQASMKHPVRLIFGATKNHDIVEADRLDSYREKLSDFDWFSVVSDPDEEHERKGYVTDHLDLDEHLHNGDADVYLCGPPPMVESVRTYLGNLASPPENFYYEKFTPQGTSDGGTEEITVTREKGRSLTVESGQVESGQIHSRMADSETQFQALNALEVGVASLVIDLLDEEDFVEMTRLAKEANRHIGGREISDAEAFIAANTTFHEFLFVRSGNEAMLQAYRSLRTEKVMVRDLQNGSMIEPEIASDHLELIEALRSRDMAAVRKVVGHHTKIAVSTMNAAIQASEAGS